VWSCDWWTVNIICVCDGCSATDSTVLSYSGTLRVFRIGQRYWSRRHRQSLLTPRPVPWLTCNPSRIAGVTVTIWERVWCLCGEILKQNAYWHDRIKFPTGCVLSMILRTNGHYFRKQVEPIGLCDGGALGSLWDGNWIFKTFSVDKTNQLDVTFCILYFSSNSCSTCFG